MEINLEKLPYPAQHSKAISRCFANLSAEPVMRICETDPPSSSWHPIAKVWDPSPQFQGDWALLNTLVPTLNHPQVGRPLETFPCRGPIESCYGLKALVWLTENWKEVPPEFKEACHGVAAISGYIDTVFTRDGILIPSLWLHEDFENPTIEWFSPFANYSSAGSIRALVIEHAEPLWN